MELESTEKQMKVVVCKIGSEEYGIPIKEVVSIERLQPITFVPNMPDYLRGITTIRGVITPIIDFRTVLNHEIKEDDDNSRMIIVKRGEEFVGLIMDGATEVIDIPTNVIQQPTFSDGDASFLIGIAMLEKRLLLLVNIQPILTDVEGFKQTRTILLKELEMES